MNIEITKMDGEVIFSGDFESIKQCVESAVKLGVSFIDADLRSLDLAGASLSTEGYPPLKKF